MVQTSWVLHHLYSIVNENLEVNLNDNLFHCFFSKIIVLVHLFRVSLTYRVKSAHKVKLTDKQLLQWMVPILLVMLIYLSTWTLSATPTAEEIMDSDGLKFKQCSYNWWDHSLGIGEYLMKYIRKKKYTV